VTLVPPAEDAPSVSIPRDLVLLLDTSGSMEGRPIEQARDVARALVRSLSDGDSLEMVAFSSTPRRWKAAPVVATPEVRKEALRWLGTLSASGGTEMRAGIIEALRPLRASAQRQVILVTDGLIGSEQRVIAEVEGKLPPGSRLHCVGIGDSVNRSLTSPVARAGRGLEVVIGIDESPVSATNALLARTTRPLVTDLVVEGSGLAGAVPSKPPDVFGAAPVLIPIETSREGGEITIRGTTASGEFRQTLTLKRGDSGTGSAAVASLFAREAVEILELELAAGGDREEIDPGIEKLGLDFQISTRLTSWVAVSEEPTVDPRAPFRRERMPQALPYGMSVEGLGLRREPIPTGFVLFQLDREVGMEAMSSFCVKAPPAPSSSELHLKATYSWIAGALVLIIEAPEDGLDWSVPSEVRLRDDEGGVVTCTPDAVRSTDGHWAPRGGSVRIVVPWPSPERRRLVEARFELPGFRFRVTLTEA
jgi:Ca-activated chloride channel family protein